MTDAPISAFRRTIELHAGVDIGHPRICKCRHVPSSSLLAVQTTGWAKLSLGAGRAACFSSKNMTPVTERPLSAGQTMRTENSALPVIFKTEVSPDPFFEERSIACLRISTEAVVFVCGCCNTTDRMH